MSLTKEQLLYIFPNARDAAVWAEAFSEAWERFGVQTRSARAGHLAIIGNETGGLTSAKREDMRYTVERAFELFPKARANPDITRQRCSTVPVDRGRRFASWIYADLYGNGPESSEDGWKFRGNGPTQITFRSTHRDCGRAIGIDLEANPDALSDDPKAGALSAAWFIAVYKPEILPTLNSYGEEYFLAGARLVGWTDDAGTKRRLEYRRKGLEMLHGLAPSDDAGSAPIADGGSGVTVPRTLRIGDIGPDVLALKQALNSEIDAMLDTDNIFDSLTHNAVRHFQTARGLGVDGIVGEQTGKALRLR